MPTDEGVEPVPSKMKTRLTTVLVVAAAIVTALGCGHESDPKPEVAAFVADKCGSWAKNLESAADAYDAFGKTSSTFDGDDAKRLPLGSTPKERSIAVGLLSERLAFCRGVRAHSGDTRFDQFNVDEVKGGDEFALADQPARAAQGLRRMATAAGQVETFAIGAN